VNRKTDQIRAAWAAGDQMRALRIAARFFDRSVDTKTFKRGMDAYNIPDFCNFKRLDDWLVTGSEHAAQSRYLYRRDWGLPGLRQ
jgi:hypothetical protein